VVNLPDSKMTAFFDQLRKKTVEQAVPSCSPKKQTTLPILIRTLYLRLSLSSLSIAGRFTRTSVSVVLSRFLHPTTVRTPHQPVKTWRPAQDRAKPTAAHPPLDPSQPKGP